MSKFEQNWARTSLVAVWLWTAVVSAWEIHGMSPALLSANAWLAPAAYPWLIWSGILVDVALGLLMALRPSRLVYLCALWMTAAMTLLGGMVDLNLWLHPLGPLSKNLPIMALLWLLARQTHATALTSTTSTSP